MSHYQDTVRNALSAEDARLYDALGRSQNPLQAAFSTLLTGEHRLFAIGGWALGAMMVAGAVYAVTRFVEAETTRAMVGWASCALAAVFALGFIKIWFFMEIQTQALLRATKRVEMEVAALGAGRADAA